MLVRLNHTTGIKMAFAEAGRKSSTIISVSFRTAT
jgi:hypothetical protein